MNYHRIVVGLTGPTGCGKTSVSKFLKGRGFEVIDADEVVSTLYLNCESLIKKIDLNFVGVVKNGFIDKKILAEIVFKNSKERLKLEKIVWPFVVETLKNFVQKNCNKNVVIDAPTLFESGAFKLCSFNIAILSNRKNRLVRIVKRDGLTKEMAINRINSQKTDSFYINRADGLILNDDSQENLFNRVRFLIDKFKKTKFSKYF